MPIQTSRTFAVQTDFLSASDAARLVARVGVVSVLRMVTTAIEEDYLRWQDFDKSARTAAHSENGVIELMPVADARDYAFKYVNGHPINTRYGLPTVMAFGALADVATGMPRFVSELTLTTALRTAATSVMVAKRLARPDSRSMALIGNGSQSEFQALAFMALLGVRELRLFDIDPATSHKLLRNLEPFLHEFGATAHVLPSVQEAVRGVDIVTTVTADKAYATILHASMVEPGMHINAVGGDCPARPSWRPPCCSAPRCLSNTSRKPASRASCSKCRPTFPSPSSGVFCKDRPQGARQRSKLRCLIRWGLRWRIIRPCAACTPWPAAPGCWRRLS